MIDDDDFWEFISFYQEIETYKRNLPHWQQGSVWYFVTFRLADSIPNHINEKILSEREIWIKNHKDLTKLTKEEKIEYYRLFSKRIENFLDNNTGSCILKDKKIAEIIARTLVYFDSQRYELDEWVIMPNHVHALVKPLLNYKLSTILHSWKSFSANEINKLLGKNGQIWTYESYDHIVRNKNAFDVIRKYIRENPTKAKTKGYSKENFFADP